MAAGTTAKAGPSRHMDTHKGAAPTDNIAAADDDGTQLTYNETIEALCNFIKTAVHTILCHRQLYPPNIFTRKQRYRVPVWASRHPGLNAYIEDVMAAVKTQIQRSLVRSVHMVLTSASSTDILERYRFDVDFILQDVAMRDRDFSIPGNMSMQSMELQLRAFMMKLISIDGALYDIDDPEDVTWAIVLDMKDGSHPQTSDSHGNEPEQGLWVPFDDGSGIAEHRRRARDGGEEDGIQRPTYLRAARRSQDDEDANDALIVPVKSLDTGVINLMLYVEEHPSAKKRPGSAKAKTSSATSTRTEGARKKQRETAMPDDEARYGERDIDEPLQVPSSSGVAAKMSKMRKKKRPDNVKAADVDAGNLTVQGNDSDASDDSDMSRGSSGSGDSIRSVNDFAGYGKGPGGVGMSGVGM